MNDACQRMCIDLGPYVGKITIDVTDAAIALALESVFEASPSLDVFGIARLRIDTIMGSFRIYDEITNCTLVDTLNAEGVLREIDLFADKLIRASASQNVLSMHSSGLLCSNGVAISLLGKSHAGKTTLALACSLSGMTFMGDEYGFLDMTTGFYSHVAYPLSIRKNTWNMFGLNSCSKAPSYLLNKSSRIIRASEIEGIKEWEQRPTSLGAIIVPQRMMGATPRLEHIRVRDWINSILCSIDAPIPRSELFGKLVDLIARKGIAVYSAIYSDISDGVALVTEASKRIMVK